MCLEEGYHPLNFRNAILCALPKPGKRPKHLPRFYRLIALLSCLGKGLEKVVARRLGDIALRYQLISPLHFGAISGRSAVDAAATLTYNVERAFGKKGILTAPAFDIKGAFDCVTETRLIRRLRTRDPIKARPIDGQTSAQEPVQIGVLTKMEKQ